MRIPGAGFLSDRRAVSSFESQGGEFRDIVFYSEGAGDWPHLGPIVTQLLNDHDRKISYLTSDPADPALGVSHANFRPFAIGAGTARTILFARLNCRRFVMTLPDLGSLWLKRSAHPVHYIYVFHSMNSTHTSYRTGAFDAYDAVLCVGPYHETEIRRTEEVYGLAPKELVRHGSAKLDTILAELGGRTDAAGRGDETEVLLAPTWGDSSFIEHPLGRDLLAELLRSGYRTVLRLHPMTVRRLPELVAELRSTFMADRRFILEEDMNATASWLRSDVMISDWSGAAIEYSLALLKPVIYIDTPPKIMNPEWERLGLPSFESTVRSRLGHVVDPAALADLPRAIEAAISDSGLTDRLRDARETLVFNIGTSSLLAASYLAGLGKEES
jgi:CDP-glycerol:poly(glycerophosphate) glycerophosphotransferase